MNSIKTRLHNVFRRRHRSLRPAKTNSAAEKAAEHFPGTDGNQTDNENTFRRAGWYETLHNKDS